MENNTPKEDWISEIMNSAGSISRAQPAVGHYGRVMERVANSGAPAVHSLPVIKWAAAAVLLVALNLASVYYYTSSKQKSVASVGNENPIAASLEVSSTYNY